MASPSLDGGHPSGRASRRQQAPSLDVTAAQSSSQTALMTEESESGTVQESRSSSSTNSPAPNDNEESDFFLAPNDSESSLGVSNLQDMHVVDDGDENVCISPVNRLPNEILISIFAKLGSSADLLHCMLTCKRWARNSVDLLWHRPACTNWGRHKSICQTLGLPNQYFHYKDFIKRLNLASIADKVSDGSVLPLAVCNRIERLTLTNCKSLTDIGLIPLIQDSHHLLALDISGDDQITEATMFAIAEHCRRLQGLNVSSCTKISNEGLIKLAESCKYIKRIKLNDCSQLTDDAVRAFAAHCPNILEIDLHQCRLITNDPVTELLAQGQTLRELRLANCELISDSAFLNLPPERVYEHLRILDLTSCIRLTDQAVDRIITVAPRLRNLVLAKCRNISDSAVNSIARLGKNLHYVHLGHCSQITDVAVKKLVQCCNRIRYIDLGCCVHLTDDSVTRLATLPKLKRIGLVKCSNITDESVNALARANQRHRQRRDMDGNVIDNQYYSHSSLERVHLSYCTSLTIRGIIKLLNSCHRLTHLSLTGVPAFLREDLGRFCRSPPPEFTLHQREVFCVFSGEGVSELREHLNNQPGYAAFRDRPQVVSAIPTHLRTNVDYLAPASNAANGHLLNFDETEADAPTDDDGMDEGSEMVVDVPPPPGGIGPVAGTGTNNASTVPIPPPTTVPYVVSAGNPLPYMPRGYVQLVRFPEDTQAALPQTQPPNAHFPGAIDSAELGLILASDVTVSDRYEAGPSQYPMSVSSSAASVAPVRVPLFQGNALAGPSTVSGQNNTYAWQLPAAVTVHAATGPTGASTAPVMRPSSSQDNGPEPPTGGSNEGGA